MTMLRLLFGALLLIVVPNDVVVVVVNAESSSKYRLYQEGEEVPLLVNKLTSTHDMYPMDYYSFPFCYPEEGPRLMEIEHLGDHLEGDHIQNSPYKLYMKQDVYCKQLCISNLGRNFRNDQQPNKVARAIQRQYHNNWIVDGLPSARKFEDDSTITTRYWGGFPIGFVAHEDNVPYVHNHVNIEIMYNTIFYTYNTEEESSKTDDVKGYEIVRFTVEPFSIMHDFVPITDGDDEDGSDVATIENPITSCNKNYRSQHTSYDMVTDFNRYPQPASGKVLFTYDVTWVESNGWLTWSNRWHVYLYMDDAIPDAVHTYAIANSIIVVVICAACLVVRISRGLKNYQRHQYQSLLGTTGDDAEVLPATPTPIPGQHESGMPALYGDVFRVPITAPRMLAIACGTGAQLLCTVIAVIVYAWDDLLVEHPGELGETIISTILWTYSFMGIIGGYVTARFSKTFFGDIQRGPAALGTSLLFPGICFGFFFLVNITARFNGSTMAIPVSAMAEIILIWMFVLTPLVFLGAYAGFSQASLAFYFPFQPRTIRRPIPSQPCYLRLPTVLLAGAVPFGGVFVELYFIMAAVWLHYYYATFGYLLASVALSLVSCSLVTIALLYLSYTKENHKWWWRSFVIGGSPALFIYFYSFFYWHGAGMGGDSGSWFIYHGYMTIVSLGISMAMGFVGLISALLFNIFVFRRLGPQRSDDESGYAMIDRE